MKFSIVVATMNRPEALRNLLDSISKQIYLPEELVIIDQSVDNFSKKVIDEYSQNINKNQIIKYFRQDKPSLVMARNRGVDESSGDIVCFVDDDIILFPDYYEKILKYFSNDYIGGVTGNVVVANPLKGYKWFFRKLFIKVFLINYWDGKLTISGFGYPIHELEINKVMDVELFCGYSMNFRKDFLIENRSDENLSGYSLREDVDLSYRISQKTRLIMAPDARFIHNHSSINRLDSKSFKRMQFKNHYYIFKKHKNKSTFSIIFFYYSVFGIILLDFLEWLFSFKKIKWDNFKFGMLAVIELIKGDGI